MNRIVGSSRLSRSQYQTQSGNVAADKTHIDVGRAKRSPNMGPKNDLWPRISDEVHLVLVHGHDTPSGSHLFRGRSVDY